jgi:hypothetical protein
MTAELGPDCQLVGHSGAQRISGPKAAHQTCPNRLSGPSLHNLPELHSKVRLGNHLDYMGFHGLGGPNEEPSRFLCRSLTLLPDLIWGSLVLAITGSMVGVVSHACGRACGSIPGRRRVQTRCLMKCFKGTLWRRAWPDGWITCRTQQGEAAQRHEGRAGLGSCKGAWVEGQS